MHLAQPDILPAHAAPRPPAPLPWEWFDFARPSIRLRHPVPLHYVDSVEGGGGLFPFAIDVDGHPVPFKIFRKNSPSPRPVLMLVHGMGLTIASFRAVARYLLPTHDLVLPDYSGFSLARDSDSLFMKTFVRSLWRIADALRVERLSLAGNSLGGGLCLMAAIDEPRRIDRIVLSNPACFPQTLPTMYRIARVPLVGELFMRITAPEKFVGGVEFIGYVDKSRVDPDLRRRYLASLGQLANRFRLMRIMRQLPAGERDLTAAPHLPRLGQLTAPVLISWGLQDPLLVAGAGERLAAALPNATYEPYPELAHMPHEEAPERIGPRWADFLNANDNTAMPA